MKTNKLKGTMRRMKGKLGKPVTFFANIETGRLLNKQLGQKIIYYDFIEPDKLIAVNEKTNTITSIRLED